MHSDQEVTLAANAYLFLHSLLLARMNKYKEQKKNGKQKGNNFGTVGYETSKRGGPIFRRLAEVAQATNCAIVMIAHLNKAVGSQSTYRGLGSIDITAVVRSLLFIQADRRCGE